MSSVFLYPRLPSGVALQLVREHAHLSLEDLAGRSDIEHPAAVFNPVGGRKVPRDRLEVLRTGMREAALQLGFPEPLGGRRGDFDRLFMEILYRDMRIVPGDAGHEGVWSFLSLVLTPELPSWRFTSRAEERLRGLPRNTFRRLWWRGHILGATPESVSHRLTEDQLVQVEERPTIGGDPRVAMSLCLALERARDQYGGVPHEALMREAAKFFIRLTPSISVYSLSDDQLRDLASEVMTRAGVGLSRAAHDAAGE